MKYDVIIIGAGPGGSRAAKVLASAGKSVALVSYDLGGECLNYGCIPTKTYLWATEIFEKISQAPTFGIHIDGAHLDWQLMKQRRLQVVDKLKKGLKFVLEKAGVKMIEGGAELQTNQAVQVTSASGTEILEASHIILATGSKALFPPEFPPNEKFISSHEILDLPEVPKSLLIIGAGAVGVEFASIFNALGSQVTLIERGERLLPNEDREISEELTRLFNRKNITILTKTTALPEQTNNFEKVLVAVGRKPLIEGLGLEKVGVQLGKRGVETNEYFQTNVPGIFAIGDLAGKALLAYSAEREADIAVEVILGKKPKPLRYDTISNTIFSSPEIASIGITEQGAQQAGTATIIGKAPYGANAKALIIGSRDGFAKIIVDQSTHKILGIHIIGERATELIGEASLAITHGLTLEDFTLNIHGHPILGEVLKDACEAALYKS